MRSSLLLSLIFTLGAAADQPSPPTAPGFSFTEVEDLARQTAGQSYQADAGAQRSLLREIPEARWNAIKFKDDRRLWRDQNLPFEVSFFHPGFIYDQVVSVNVVEDGQARPLEFDPGMFEIDSETAEEMKGQRLNFAGFRLHFPLNDNVRKDEAAAFLGGTHFRAVARHATYGLTARGLILNPAGPEGEEFPFFRRFWLVRPEPEATSLTLYALLDSPSLTGAYQFLITPGSTSIIEVKASLFKRSGASWPAKIGLAPMGSMYLFSEKENGSPKVFRENGPPRDWRPEVHNSDSLLVADPQGQWQRRPLLNPGNLKVSAFDLPAGLKGFGLMQSDDDFSHYQDINARFDRRSSLWVEPDEAGGPGGRLELIEIPSSRDYNDNVLAFWRPERLAPGQKETDQTPSFNFSYRMYWMAPGATPHQLGRVAATRLALDQQGTAANFVIDFESESLSSLSQETGLASRIETPEDLPVLEKNLRKNPVTGGWRLTLKTRAPQEKGVVESLISAGDEPAHPRFRAELIRGENLPERLTETWVYDLPR